jgi:hypothetical protein
MSEPAEVYSAVHRELMLVEYKSLRDECLKRMDHRITLLVSSITVSGAILGIGLERNNGPLLLVAPIVTVLFGLLVLYHTKAIADVSRYLLTDIEQPLDEQYPGAMGWHGRPAWRKTRFREIFTVFHLPIMLTVAVPTVAALALAWQYEGHVGVKIPLAVLDGLLVVFYVVQYLRRISRPLGATAAPTSPRP